MPRVLSFSNLMLSFSWADNYPFNGGPLMQLLRLRLDSLGKLMTMCRSHPRRGPAWKADPSRIPRLLECQNLGSGVLGLWG